MSFGDLEKGYGGGMSRGVGVGGTSGYQSSAGYQLQGNAGRDADQEYMQLSERVTQGIQTIANNVGAINKLVVMLGTPKDTQDLRDQLHDVSEQTKETIREANKDIKTLGKLDGGSPTENQARRRQQTGLSTKLKSEMERYSTALRNAQQKEREYVAQAKKEQSNKQNEVYRGSEEDSAEETRNLLQEEARRQQLMATQNELDHNEQLITEREEGIEEITSNIQMVNEIMRDLNRLVTEQGDTVDTIERNVEETVAHTKGAKEEVKQASYYQKLARNKMCCILLIFAIILIIIVLVVVFKVVV